MQINLFLSLFLMQNIFAEDAPINHSEAAEKLYIKLFKSRRAEQLEAVKNIRNIGGYEKQYSMIMLLAEKIFTVIQDSRAMIEASGFIPVVSPFPTDEKIQGPLSNILENTALFSDVILRYPDISIAVLKTNNNWDVLLQWSIAFANQIHHLLDKNTIKLLNLVSQELNHIERDPDYVNPYRKSNKVEETQHQSTVKAEKKKKKKEIKKGPRFTQNRFEL